MQASFRRDWHAICASREGKEVEPDRVGDFGFLNPPDYVRSRCSMFLNYSVLPKAGGLDDQDESFIRDLQTWLAGLNAVAWDRSQLDKQIAAEQGKLK